MMLCSQVADMKTITLAAAVDLREAKREAQDALLQRNEVEMDYKERSHTHHYCTAAIVHMECCTGSSALPVVCCQSMYINSERA